MLWKFGVSHSSFHASFILRRGLTGYKSFLGLRIGECRNSSDILEWGPGALQTSHSLLPIIYEHGLDTSRCLKLETINSVYLSTIPLFIIIHLDQFHLKLLSCWVESTHPSAARVVDSRPSVLLHPSDGHNSLTRCRLQMFLNPL